MKEELIEIAKYRFQKAKNVLADAKKYFEGVSPVSSVNRIYYAMFYAVSALLITRELSASKHSGVRALFNKEFVSKGMVEKEMGKFYSEMYDKRHKGDYEDFVKFEREDVKIYLEKAEKFVEKIEKLVNKIIRNGNAKKSSS